MIGSSGLAREVAGLVDCISDSAIRVLISDFHGEIQGMVIIGCT
jgi:hypothetical protein